MRVHTLIRNVVPSLDHSVQRLEKMQETNRHCRGLLGIPRIFIFNSHSLLLVSTQLTLYNLQMCHRSPTSEGTVICITYYPNYGYVSTFCAYISTACWYSAKPQWPLFSDQQNLSQNSP